MSKCCSCGNWKGKFRGFGEKQMFSFCKWCNDKIRGLVAYIQNHEIVFWSSIRGLIQKDFPVSYKTIECYMMEVIYK